jgi:hypothetical protein
MLSPQDHSRPRPVNPNAHPVLILLNRQQNQIRISKEAWSSKINTNSFKKMVTQTQFKVSQHLVIAPKIYTWRRSFVSWNFQLLLFERTNWDECNLQVYYSCLISIGLSTKFLEIELYCSILKATPYRSMIKQQLKIKNVEPCSLRKL